jgi:hypothetical protein
MSLVTTASLWTNEDNQKKRQPTMRRTVKLKPNISTIGEPDEYVSQTENYQNQQPPTMDDIQQSMEQRNTRVNELLNKITSADSDTDGKMGNFNPMPNPNMNIKKDMENNTEQPLYKLPVVSYPNASNSLKNGNYSANDTQSGVYSNYNASYQPPSKILQQPYYAKMGVGLSGGDDKIMEKINYMIHLLEEQQNEKTNNITEEFILYTFLGVFIIFVVDSFARSGKYTR